MSGLTTAIDGYWNFVPAYVVYGVFEKIVVVQGFQMITKAMRAEEVSDGIIHLITSQLTAKGLSELVYGAGARS